jgi:hypothetical protein
MQRGHRGCLRRQVYGLEQVSARDHADDAVALVNDGQVAEAHSAEQGVAVGGRGEHVMRNVAMCAKCEDLRAR